MTDIKKNNKVVLVHGIFNTGKAFKKISDTLISHGYLTYMPSLSPNTGKAGLDALALQLESYIAQQFSPKEKFYLIGFSMGGIICRYYLQKLSGLNRVIKFISLSVPHMGSKMAYLMSNKGCIQMRPNSEFMNDLNKDIHVLNQVDVVSIWTPFDLSIIPATSSSISIGKEIKVNVLLHPLMLRNKQSIDAIIEEIKQKMVEIKSERQ